MAAGTDASGGGLAGSNGAAATAKGSDSASSSRLQAMTRSFHGAVIALVLSLAVFRFFIQGKGTRAWLVSGEGTAGGERVAMARMWGSARTRG